MYRNGFEDESIEGGGNIMLPYRGAKDEVQSYTFYM